MNISTISNKKDIKEFHEVPFIIYKNNKNWYSGYACCNHKNDLHLDGRYL